MMPERYKTLGYISKPHGVTGEAIVRTDFDIDDDIFETEWVFLLIEGKPVPFFIDDMREKSDDAVIVSFNDFSTPEEVVAYVGCTVLVADTSKKAKKTPVDEYNIVGYSILDKTRGELGAIAEMVDIPGNPLLRIEGAKEFYIPLQADFLLKIDKKKKVLHVDLPEGLIDLNVD